MPGFYAHYLLGEISRQRMTTGRLRESIEAHPMVYTIGQQGPDVFFYYFLTIRGWHYSYGSLLHRKNTNKFFRYLMEAGDLENGENRKIADAYLAGAMGHYILDTRCHPYVYGMVSRKKSREIYGKHTSLESDMDAALLMRYEHKKLSETRMHRMIRVSAKERLVIARMLAHAMNLAYPEIKISVFNAREAIRSMQMIARILEDPKGWKTKLSYALEMHLWGSICVTPMFCSDLIYNEDSCNSRHKLWRNPWEESTISSRSVFDMMEIAIRDYGYLASHLEFALEGKCTYQDFLEQFGDLSYHSGLECEH